MEPTHVSELAIIIKDQFGWNKARCTCFAYFVIGLLAVCTVTLSKVSTTFSGRIQLTSRQKRLKRFLVWLCSQVDYKLIFASFVLKRFSGQLTTLSIDRTNWKLGSFHINFLVAGIWYHGVSIPIFWTNLGVAGNSNTLIRIETVQALLKKVPSHQIEWILADREFVGEEWFKFLIDSSLPFSIRIKGNVWVEIRRGRYRKTQKVAELFSNLKPGQTKVFNGCLTYGCTINLAACISPEGGLVVIATNKSTRRALKIYKKRWSVETLFSCLKGRGFNFEDTRIVDPKRGEALLFVLSFAMFWSMQIGTDHTCNKPLEIAKHGRPRVSVFRRGLDLLRESIIQVCTMLELLLSMITVLKSPYQSIITKS